MNLSNIQVDIAQILGLTAATVLAALGQRVWVLLNRVTGNRAAETLQTLAPAAVHAAEELDHKLTKVNGNIAGKEKLDFAVARLMDLAKLGHIKLTEEQAKAIIEGTLNQARPYMTPTDFDLGDAQYKAKLSPSVTKNIDESLDARG